MLLWLRFTGSWKGQGPCAVLTQGFRSCGACTLLQCPDVAHVNPELIPETCVQGPTLTMRVHEYSLMRDVLATLARPRHPASMWKAPPLVVMNNFGGHEELQLATVLFQNLFPPINVQTAKLSSCQVGAL